MSSKNSKNILKHLIDEFKVDKNLPNVEYLEHQMSHLARMCAVYKSQSINVKLSARNRAQARDLEQTCLGLINGIKFGISFCLNKDVDLMNVDHTKEENSEVYPN